MKAGDERPRHAILAVNSDLVTQGFASFEDTALLTGKCNRRICATKEMYSSILHFILLQWETGTSPLDSSVLSSLFELFSNPFLHPTILPLSLPSSHLPVHVMLLNIYSLNGKINLPICSLVVTPTISLHPCFMLVLSDENEIFKTEPLKDVPS